MSRSPEEECRNAVETLFLLMSASKSGRDFTLTTVALEIESISMYRISAHAQESASERIAARSTLFIKSPLENSKIPLFR